MIKSYIYLFICQRFKPNIEKHRDEKSYQIKPTSIIKIQKNRNIDYDWKHVDGNDPKNYFPVSENSCMQMQVFTEHVSFKWQGKTN